MMDSSAGAQTVTDMTPMLTPSRSASRTMAATRPAMLTRRPGAASRHGRRRRGAELIEFALLMPLFLYMIIFSIDMGQMVLLSGVVHDDAFVGARASAELGGGTTGTAAAQKAVKDSLSLVPTVNASQATVTVPDQYSTCNTSGQPSGTYIQVNVSYPAQFITPGLSSLMSLMNPSSNDSSGAWTLKATGVARCEIVRSG